MPFTIAPKMKYLCINLTEHVQDLYTMKHRWKKLYKTYKWITGHGLKDEFGSMDNSPKIDL